MNPNNSKKIAYSVIQTEIIALKKLKKSLGKSFNLAIKTIVNCKSGKIVISGVGKSGIIGKKWAATFSSTGTPSFFLDAGNASHGDLGQISSNDVVVLISLSGSSDELKNIIQFCSRNKNIKLIGVTSNKQSLLYKNSDVKLLTPYVKEAGPGAFVPTSSTTVQLVLGDALAISCMKSKKFTKLDFKKFHPGGSLSVKLKTVGDLMLKGNKIPFINQKLQMEKALSLITKKKLGVLIAVDNKKFTTGIITDGQIRRFSQKNANLKKLHVCDIMTSNPLTVDKDTLASKALSIMSQKKITSLCVHRNKKRRKTIGLLHIHHILSANIS